eukprot:5709-Amphidinium_carterae.1
MECIFNTPAFLGRVANKNSEIHVKDAPGRSAGGLRQNNKHDDLNFRAWVKAAISARIQVIRYYPALVHPMYPPPAAMNVDTDFM